MSADPRHHVQSIYLNVSILNRPSLLASVTRGPHGFCFWCEVDFGEEDDEDEDLERVEAFCSDDNGDGIFDGDLIHRYCDSERADRTQLLWPHDPPAEEWYESETSPGLMMTDANLSYSASEEFDLPDDGQEDVAFTTPTGASAPAGAGTPGAKEIVWHPTADETPGPGAVSKTLQF